LIIRLRNISLHWNLVTSKNGVGSRIQEIYLIISQDKFNNKVEEISRIRDNLGRKRGKIGLFQSPKEFYSLKISNSGTEIRKPDLVQL